MATIGRIYSTAEEAQDVMAALEAGGFGKNAKQLLTPESVGTTTTPEKLTGPDVMGGDLADNLAFVFSKALNAGQSVVLVSPMFGTGAAAEAILDSIASIGGANMTPLKPSSPVFSEWLGLPTLANRDLTFWSRSLFSPLTRPGWTFSGMLGIPLLSKNPTPLSSMIGFKPTSGNKGPFKGTFGLPLISRNGTPLSSLLGLPTLVKSESAKRR